MCCKCHCCKRQLPTPGKFIHGAVHNFYVISFIRSISGLSDNRAQIRLVYQPDQSQVVWAELNTGEHLNLEWSAGNQPVSVLERFV